MTQESAPTVPARPTSRLVRVASHLELRGRGLRDVVRLRREIGGAEGQSKCARRSTRRNARRARLRAGAGRAKWVKRGRVPLLVTHFRRFARRTLPWSKIEVFPVRSISLDIFEAMLAVVRAVRNGT